MKRILLALSLLLTGIPAAFAQTYATDFTADDCSSISRHLFAELDNGKIVVLVWVMPCSNCISDAKGAFDAAESFAISHPGKVLFYLADDLGNTSCATLAAWATNNGISHSIQFSNAGMPLNEADYGGTGMPHVVVMGGTDHKIFFNQLNGSNDMAAIQSAINQALSTTAVAELPEAVFSAALSPNPATEKISVHYTLSRPAAVRFSISNVMGVTVREVSLPRQSAGSYDTGIPFDAALADGMYFLRMNAEESTKVYPFVIAR